MNDLLANFKVMQKKLETYHSNEHLKLDIEIYKKFLTISQPGRYYYFTFDPRKVEFLYVSPGINDVLGFTSEEMNMNLFTSLIHPNDVHFFLNFEQAVGQFFLKLDVTELFKYKIRYDFRIRTLRGSYKRILHQMVIMQVDPGFHNFVTLGIHTDISDLKPEGKPVMSIFGFDGAPSYIDVDIAQTFLPAPSVLSVREKEIIALLIEGLASKQIAEQLSISKQTVDQHRKNMLAKTGTKNTTELVAAALKKGWV